MDHGATIAFVGDVMLGRGVQAEAARRGAAWVWGDVLPLLQSADAVFANLESPITRSAQRWPGFKTWRFRADPTALDVLRVANVRFVNLANNHILDYCERGLMDTLHHLEAAGIAHAGAGADRVAASAGTLMTVGDLKVGILGVTDNMSAFAAGPDCPGTHHVPIIDSVAVLQPIADSVAELRRQGACFIVVSAHWGPNMRLQPTPAFRRFARALMEAGVDLIHGHSAHVVHAIERRGSRLVLYDTGNMIDDYWKFPFRRTRWSFVFLLEIVHARARRLTLVPVEIGPVAVRLARGQAFDAIAGHMARLCSASGHPLRPVAHGLELALDGIDVEHLTAFDACAAAPMRYPA